MAKTFFDTVDDSNQRVRNTVILYEGEPCFVNLIYGMNTKPIADISILPTGKGKRIQEVPFTSEKFQVRKLPPLGYVNYVDNSYYLSRAPARQSRQGFCRETVIIPVHPDFRAPTWGNLLESPALVNMLTGKYGSFKDTFEKVSGSQEPLGMAFSRTFALSIDDLESVTLWYRGMKVASANNPRKYGPVFTLPKKFEYLREECQENRIKLEA